MHERAVLYTVLVVVAVTACNAYALEANTSYGLIRLDPHVYFLEGEDTVTVRITGEIYLQGTQNVVITVTDPSSHSLEIPAKSARDGRFEASVTLDHSSPAGTYYVSGSASGKRLGQLTFEVVNPDPPPSFAPPASAPPPPPAAPPPPLAGTHPLTVATDRGSYDAGDVIRVSGEGPPGELIALRVSSPRGGIISVDPAVANPDGRYSAAVPAGGNLWSAGGTYTVSAGHGVRVSEHSFVLEVPQARPGPPARQAQLTVATDRGSYDAGDVIHISGEGMPGVPVALRVLDPGGGTIPVDPAVADPDGAYSAAVHTGGDPWSRDGTYTVSAEYRGQTAHTTLVLKTAPAPLKFCQDPTWECIRDSLSQLVRLAFSAIMPHVGAAATLLGMLFAILLVMLLVMLAGARAIKGRRAAARRRRSVAGGRRQRRRYRPRPIVPQRGDELLVFDSSAILPAVGYDKDPDMDYDKLLRYMGENIGRVRIPRIAEREIYGVLKNKGTPEQLDTARMFDACVKNPRIGEALQEDIRRTYRQTADEPGSARADRWLREKRRDVERIIGKEYPETRDERIKALDGLCNGSSRDQDIAAAAVAVIAAAGGDTTGAFLVSNDGDHTVFADEISRIAGGRLRVIRPEELTDLS